jgi:DNA-binding GntR family transcriptional regulator
VELATERATAKDIETLEQMQARARQFYDSQDWENFLKTDEAMHTFIGTMTRNPVFQFVQKSIHDNIHRYYQDFLPMNSERTLENLIDFDKIIAAMKAGDGATASAIITDHVQRFHDKMTGKQP